MKRPARTTFAVTSCPHDGNNKPVVFFYEHVTATADACLKADQPLYAQASRLARAVIDDLRPLTRHTLTFDGCAADITGGSVDDRFIRLARQADVTLVLAPETDGVLHHFVSLLGGHGVPTLNATPEAVALCGDKYRLWEHLERRGIATVPTYLAPDTLSRPFLIKRRDGAGCEDTQLVDEVSTSDGGLIYQPYVPTPPSIAASVGMLVMGQWRCVFPASQQLISIHGKTLHYNGNRFPLAVQLAERARDLACSAVASVAGLRGFVGVDLILSHDPQQKPDLVVEINPRLTCSYLGHRELAPDKSSLLNLALCSERSVDAELTFSNHPLELTFP